MRGDSMGAEYENLSDYENNKKEYTKIDILKNLLKVYLYLTEKWFMNDTPLEHPNGNMCLIRKDEHFLINLQL